MRNTAKFIKISLILIIFIFSSGFAAQVPIKKPQELQKVVVKEDVKTQEQKAPELIAEEKKAPVEITSDKKQQNSEQKSVASNINGEEANKNSNNIVSQSNILQIAGIKEKHKLSPYLKWYHDTEGNTEIAQIAKLDMASLKNFSEERPNTPGVIWLILDIAPINQGLERQVYIKLGDENNVYGDIKAYASQTNSIRQVIVREESKNLFPLLASLSGGKMYFRLEGIPDYYFEPLIGPRGKVQDSMQNTIHTLMLCLLILSSILCLLRAVFDKKVWRIWGSLFAICAFISQAWGVSSLSTGVFNLFDLPALLAPAIALFILPFIGYNMMFKNDKVLNIALISVAFIGLVVALSPALNSKLLIYTPLWPCLATLSLATAIIAFFKDYDGSHRFLLICALTSIPAILQTIDNSLTTNLSAYHNNLTIIGLAMTSFLMAIMSPNSKARNILNRQNDENEVLQLELANDKEFEKVEHLFFDDNKLFLEQNQLELFDPQQDDVIQVEQKGEVLHIDHNEIVKIEEGLRVPLDALLRHAIALDHCSLSDEARSHLNSLIGAGREMTSIITNLSRTGVSEPSFDREEFSLIDLPTMLRAIHKDTAQIAEDRNLAFSWYLAPHLGRKYYGPAKKINYILRQLMHNAVYATEQGAIQLWVRRVPDSNDPGELMFTIVDTGAGAPPHRRNALILSQVWELTGEFTGGLQFNSDLNGTSVSFSIRLNAVSNRDTATLEKEMVNSPSLRLILVDEEASRRQLLAYMLESLPHELIEARSADEAVKLHNEIPARLIIFDASMPENEIFEAISAIRNLDGENEIPPTVITALVTHEALGERLKRAGCDHIIYKPVHKNVIRQTILHLAPVPGHDLPPLPEQNIVKDEVVETSENEIITLDEQVQDENLAIQHGDLLANDEPKESPNAKEEIHGDSLSLKQENAEKKSKINPLKRLTNFFKSKDKKEEMPVYLAPNYITTDHVGEPQPLTKTDDEFASNSYDTGEKTTNNSPLSSFELEELEAKQLADKQAEEQARRIASLKSMMQAKKDAENRTGENEISPAEAYLSSKGIKKDKKLNNDFESDPSEIASGDWVSEAMPVSKPEKNIACDSSSLNNLGYEGVGEPMPIAKSEESASTINNYAFEAVGEPMPIVKKPQISVEKDLDEDEVPTANIDLNSTIQSISEQAMAAQNELLQKGPNLDQAPEIDEFISKFTNKEKAPEEKFIEEYTANAKQEINSFVSEISVSKEIVEENLQSTSYELEQKITDETINEDDLEEVFELEEENIIIQDEIAQKESQELETDDVFVPLSMDSTEQSNDMQDLAKGLVLHEDKNDLSKENLEDEILTPLSEKSTKQKVLQKQSLLDLIDLDAEDSNDTDNEMIEIIGALAELYDDAYKAYNSNNISELQNITDTIANNSEKVGLRVLADIARRISLAAESEDFMTIDMAIPQLKSAIEKETNM